MGKGLTVSLWLFAAPTLWASELPQMHIDTEKITVSGISSGAQMAHQLHLAYSDLYSGAALLAGGPFGCAEGSVANALGRCLAKPGTEIPLKELQSDIIAAAPEGRLADLQNLSDDPVWLFHGSLDQAVPEAVNTALLTLYKNLVPAENIRSVTDVPAAHVFPASGSGGPCDRPETPFVGNCGYDAAGDLLQHLYPALEKPVAVSATPLVKTTLPGAGDALLDETAWLFIPPACSAADAACALHVVFHGCAQSVSQVQMKFIQQSGYLPWAAQNNIVLAFPQVVASTGNPLACWDWWGYSDTNYLWRDGKQMRVLANWTRQLAGLQPF